jgi:hypothetical protein
MSFRWLLYVELGPHQTERASYVITFSDKCLIPLENLIANYPFENMRDNLIVSKKKYS